MKFKFVVFFIVLISFITTGLIIGFLNNESMIETVQDMNKVEINNIEEVIPIMNRSDFTIENKKDEELYQLPFVHKANSYDGYKYVPARGITLEEIASYSKEIKTITEYGYELFNEKKYKFYSDYFMVVDVQYDGNVANWIMEDIYGNKIISKNENTIKDNKEEYKQRMLCKINKIVFRPIAYNQLEWVVRTNDLEVEDIIKHDKTIKKENFDKIKQKYNIKEYDYRIEIDISEKNAKKQKVLKYLKEYYGEDARFEIKDIYKSKLYNENIYICSVYSEDIDSEFEYIDYGDRVSENFVSLYLEKNYNIKSITDFTKYEENKINNKLKEINTNWAISLLDLTGSFEERKYGHLPEPEEVYKRNDSFVNIDKVYYNSNKTPQVINASSHDNNNLSLEQLQDVLKELKDNNIKEVIEYLTKNLSISEQKIKIRYQFKNNGEDDNIEINLGDNVLIRHYGTPFLQRIFYKKRYFRVNIVN